MRILWASNAPWVGTGYGVQTAQVITRLHRDGHDVAVSANWGLDGGYFDWNGILTMGKARDTYGQDAIPTHYEKWAKGQPTVVITLYDVWVYKNPAFDALPIASWTPIDHLQVPPEVAEFSRKHRPIAMSKHGVKTLAAAGIKADYVPHAVDTNVFRPVETEARKILDIPEDAFVVLINAANTGNTPPRKSWGEMLTAFARFSETHKDAYLYLHTDLVGVNGMPLLPLLDLRKIPPDRVRMSNQEELALGMIPAKGLNELYNMADVLLLTSKGEGFGVPAIEAQAAGTPVILSDATAQRELCGAGWLVETQPDYDFRQGADFVTPIIDSIVARLEDAYAAKANADIRRKAVEFATQYDAEIVYQDHWKPLVADLERWVTPTRQQRRAAARKAGKAA